MRGAVGSVLGEHVAQVGEGAIDVGGAVKEQRQQQGCKGPGGCESQQCGPSLHPRCSAAGPQVGRCGPSSAAGQKKDELDGLSAPASRDLDGEHYEASPRGMHELGVGALLVRACEAEGRADPTAPVAPRAASLFLRLPRTVRVSSYGLATAELRRGGRRRDQRQAAATRLGLVPERIGEDLMRLRHGSVADGSSNKEAA